jgi:hypothetical protein
MTGRAEGSMQHETIGGIVELDLRVKRTVFVTERIRALSAAIAITLPFSVMVADNRMMRKLLRTPAVIIPWPPAASCPFY